MKFKYSIDGHEGETFDADTFEDACNKVMGWSGLSVWEVQ